jgi:hypothetical protein
MIAEDRDDDLSDGVEMELRCPWCGTDLTAACDGRLVEYDDVLGEHVQSCEPWLSENPNGLAECEAFNTRRQGMCKRTLRADGSCDDSHWHGDHLADR